MKNNKESKARERKRDMQLKGPMSLTEQFIIPSRVLCRIYTQWDTPLGPNIKELSHLPSLTGSLAKS
ncbi:hypothetical protein SCA6_020039 [Theobroma cacao]